MEIVMERFTAARRDEVVIVKLWEVYVLYHPSNLYRVLSDVSLDKAPITNQITAGRIIFRFTREVWEDVVKNLLYEHRIPVVIESRQDRIHAASRQPVLR